MGAPPGTLPEVADDRPGNGPHASPAGTTGCLGMAMPEVVAYAVVLFTVIVLPRGMGMESHPHRP